MDVACDTESAVLVPSGAAPLQCAPLALYWRRVRKGTLVCMCVCVYWHLQITQTNMGMLNALIGLPGTDKVIAASPDGKIVRLLPCCTLCLLLSSNVSNQ